MTKPIKPLEPNPKDFVSDKNTLLIGPFSLLYNDYLKKMKEYRKDMRVYDRENMLNQIKLMIDKTKK